MVCLSLYDCDSWLSQYQENVNSLGKAENKTIIEKEATPIASFFLLSAYNIYST
jgi:hypothetical protein